MLPLKWYPLVPNSTPRINSMQALSPTGKELSFLRFISLSLTAFFLLAIAPASRAQNGPRPDASLTVAEQYLFAAANQDRANQGLPPLRLDPVLTQASAFHAREMAEHDAISHQFPNEPELAERGSNAGVHFSR